MSAPRELLDQLDQAHAAAASTVPTPWAAWTGVYGALGADDVNGSIAVDYSTSYDSSEDAEEARRLVALIVTAANHLPQLTAALRAVLDLHVPDEDMEACKACWIGLDQDGTCPTVRAITAVLSPAQPQSGDRP